MSISRSLIDAASSLRANQREFDVISNNIANVSTTGYKSNSANFVDEFSQIYNYGSSPSASASGTGGTDPIQYGLGVSIGSIGTDMSQGTIETTNVPLNMALQGNGYFVYNLNGQQVYSRAGDVTQDQAGNLVDSSTGAYLEGYNIQKDATGKLVQDSSGTNVLSRTVSNLVIPPNVQSMPHQTQNIDFSGNLDASAATGATYPSSIDIYDNTGGTHSLSLTFTKTATPNQFTVTGTIDGTNVPIGSSTVTFNKDGTIQSPMSLSINASDLNTALGSTAFDATTPKNVNIVLGDPNNLVSGS